VIEVIGNHYKFSPRLLGIMCTAPSPKAMSQPQQQRRRDRLKNRIMRDDVERGVPESPASTTGYSEKEKVKMADNPSEPSHYSIAGQMINYSSTDISDKCMLAR